MKTLLIKAHPDFNNQESYSNTLRDQFLKKYHAEFSDTDLTELNLYDMNLPKIEKGQLLTVWTKQTNGEKLTVHEQQVADQSSMLLSQLKDNHRVVISMPVHNFNVPSRLKDWIDNILIARETFRYLSEPLENGRTSKGLMTDDYRLMVLVASGSIYTRDDFYQHLDIAIQYLHAIFVDIMGFAQLNIVRAEGTSIMPVSRTQILKEAFAQLDGQFVDFYKK